MNRSVAALKNWVRNNPIGEEHCSPTERKHPTGLSIRPNSGTQRLSDNEAKAQITMESILSPRPNDWQSARSKGRERTSGHRHQNQTAKGRLKITNHGASAHKAGNAFRAVPKHSSHSSGIGRNQYSKR